jgi:hypothetical protein
MNGICKNSGIPSKDQIYELWVKKKKRYKPMA